MHKKPDKVEIENLELFLSKSKPEMLTVIPEQVKPDLNKIKNYIKSKCNAPPKAREKLGQKSREKLNDIFIC